MIVARKLHQRRRKRRRRTLDTILLQGFTAWMIVAGGASGILVGALILDQISPGHPIYLAIQDWLRGIFN